MNPEVWVLVAWFGYSNGGPAMLKFETFEECEHAKEIIAQTYWPDAFKEQGWTTNSQDYHSYKNTKCLEVSIK